MINRDDIEAFEADFEIADRVIKRAEQGVDPQRLLMTREIMPFLRAYVLMRNAAADAALFMTDLKKREEDGMKVHEAGA